MGKKSKRVRSSNNTQQDARQAPSNRNKDMMACEEVETAENLKFEDPFYDEVEEDDVVDDDQDDEEDDEKMADDSDEKGAIAGDAGVELVQSWHPLMGIAPEEPLELDPSAYKMYHTLSPEWPSLSFNFLKDNLGDARQRFPHSLQAVFGTQADDGEPNTLTVMKLSDLSKLPQEEEEDVLGDEYDKDGGDDSSSDEEDVDLDPILEHYHLPHEGGVNRVRAMPQSSDIVATWSDAGKVNLYNISHIRSRFDSSEGKASQHQGSSNQPFFVHTGHTTEGFAIDWSPVKKGVLASGDNNGHIHLWTPRPGGQYEVSPSYEASEKVSVEDLQWSPSEATVFCAAESGGHISIYDTRAPNRAMLRHLAHANKADVNVISWNRLVSNLLATGGDDGTLSVWDLRHFTAQKTTAPLARFSCHKTPITSVEWHPTDESMLAASDTVGSYIYDLSVEEDTDANKDSSGMKTLVADIPPQLLFCHSGSQEFKEVHWHPQISSCVMTTAYSGFSVFIPSNL